MIYFTADLHFYHDNVIRHCNRPFDNAQQMNKALIENWNSIVTANDEIYILGDFTMKGAENANLVLSQLKGKKYLIRGNHDKFVDSETFENSFFEWVKDYYQLKYNNDRFILFHYPIKEWNGFFKGTFNLHGHQHNIATYNYKNAQNKLKQYDVGVDANNMLPVSIEEIIKFFEPLL